MSTDEEDTSTKQQVPASEKGQKKKMSMPATKKGGNNTKA
jgi:hypothetical protein